MFGNRKTNWTAHIVNLISSDLFSKTKAILVPQ